MLIRRIFNSIFEALKPDPLMLPRNFEKNSKSPAAYRAGYRSYPDLIKNPHAPGTDMYESWEHGRYYAELQAEAW